MWNRITNVQSVTKKSRKKVHFPPLEATDVPDDEEEEADDINFLLAGGDATIRVVTLGGDEKKIQFNVSKKVRDFKHLVEREFGVDPGKQRLLFNEKELEVSLNMATCYAKNIALCARSIMTSCKHF